MDGVSAYPLQWPAGKPRTKRPEYSRFRVSPGQARDGLMDELERLGATHVTISSNQKLRQDGMPYANGPRIEDAGVAVYFMMGDQPRCFACDRWELLHENMHAIAKSIQALRGLSRWGSSEMVDQAFSGFEALPPGGESSHWSDVLGVPATASLEEVKRARRELAFKHHPDRGGDPDQFVRIETAYDQFILEFAKGRRL